MPPELPPPLARAVAKAGFANALDVLLHFPLRHEDWQNAHPVAALKNGAVAMVEGDIIECKTIPARKRQQLIVYLQDSDGDVVGLRFFHVTPGLKHFLEVGRHLRARGKAMFNTRNGWEIAHPKFTTSEQGKAVRAVYPTLKNMTPKALQTLAAKVLEHAELPPTIPAQVDNFDGADWTLAQALRAAHAPAADGASPLPPDHAAWRRMRFEELVAHQIVLRRRYHYRRPAPALQPPDGWRARLDAALPFALTAAQQRAIADITKDLARPYPMRRLLQGDVGSGKTAVAAAACYIAILAGHNAAIMAPTEILAEQHYTQLSALFEKMNLHCELLTGSITPKRRQEAENRLRFGISSLAIGTHALFQDSTLLPRLGLAVIDEQHRFGVEQRKSLMSKGDDKNSSSGTHQLMMSATPIPRTLALSLYADMDVSVLDEKPAGRQPVRTIISAGEKRADIIDRVATHVSGGGRVYWVCPLVEESVNSVNSDMSDVNTLAADIHLAHPSLRVGVIHGRMKAAEKNAVMEKFRDGALDLLAATTVIEVGVDVAQADVMVIERADRMGLSQLHQLRGRVGRGDRPGVCVLMYQTPLSPEARERLTIMRDTTDGFEVARRDLAMRGPGEWLGNRQSGLPSLRVARLGEDDDLADAARKTAEWMLKNNKRACIHHTRRWLGGLKR